MATARDRCLAPVYRVAELRALEARSVGAGLMERAGAAAAETARAMLEKRAGPVVVLAGPGNNGGDGFVVARLLRAWFYDVAVVFRGDFAALPADAGNAYNAYVAAGGTTVSDPPASQPALVVDALFGLGLRRALADDYASLVRWANEQAAPILAIDIPTGLDADTGVATAPTIRANATVTFIALKAGLLTAEGPDLCGTLTVDALDLDPEASEPAQGHALAWPALAAALPDVFARREKGVHKGTFGTLGIVGGSSGMAGAAVLAGRAALRLGAGKVRIGFTAHDPPAFDPVMPELMLSGAHDVLGTVANAWVVGCGLGSDALARDSLDRAIASGVPLVLDADGLNLLAQDPVLRSAVQAREAATFATPHPAEAARLLGTDVAAIQHDRIAAARVLARELHAHVVLKGVGSVLAHPDGSWDVNTSGNPALAFAGSGDVLAGMLGACIVQHGDAKDALRIAVCLHGAAADALVARGIGPVGVGAAELIDAARELINRAGGGRAGEPSSAG